MMRRLVQIFCLLGLSLVIGSVSWAEMTYFEGEGYFTPTPQSREQLNVSNYIQPNRGASGDRITLNVLATNFPNLVLYATVRHSDGSTVGGLGAGDFTVSENGISETITGFTADSGACGNIAVCLVFDVSGSMDGSRLSDAKNAAIQFVNGCNAQRDRIGLVKFSDVTELVFPVDFIDTDNDHNGTYDIIDAINGLTADGSTAVYDGTMVGINALSQEAQPKAVLAFSDGETNSDNISINEVITAANRDSIPLYTCGFGIDSQNMHDMASQTGAQYLYAPTASDMLGFYNEIAGGMCSNYIIYYTTHNPDYDGTTRTVTVSHDNGTTIGTAIYVVNYKPEIFRDSITTNLSHNSQPQNQPLNICGTVIDKDAEAQQQNLSAQIFYRHIGSSGYTSDTISLTSQGNGQYSFCTVIPAGTVQGPGVEYYFYVTDGVQQTYAPFNYSSVPYAIPVLPNHAPVITHNPITRALCQQAIVVDATVTDQDSGDSVARVALYYRSHDVNQITPFYTLEMTATGGGNYRAEIPADSVDENGIDYFIVAWDSHFARADHGTAENPHFIDVNCATSCGCSIQLQPGWNLIGFCGSSSQPVATALATINSLYSSVWSFENGAWKVYDAQYPGFSDLTELQPCHGYWINMDSAGTLTFR